MLQESIESLIQSAKSEFTDNDYAVLEMFKGALNAGTVRAAERRDDGTWHVNAWVKRGILLGFKMGRLTDMSPPVPGLPFFDRHTWPVQRFALARNVRIVPGGTSIRDGAFVAAGVVVMPPSYINVGAYVDAGTMVDSHALVGSCAQVGQRVHLSAAVQVGGVLEPAGALPVIIEDDAFLGGGCGVYEGTIVRRRAVLSSGVILSGSTAIYDLVRGMIYRRTADRPLEVPEGAVVVPGSRPADNEQARKWGVSLYAPVIVKYRDEKTDAGTMLEDALR
ncbi:MAG TPA: 2,3,4,5-tetrahydropyridine-2,6-dicarboxylate N-succinyltransferase [Tepidisphaeraceae bacterium]|nr:2,3,4,5-tetrahydropyridine-2,6-dicarboxylate N-succinyltransferase [Tepidisphaeraceae bacterium]